MINLFDYNNLISCVSLGPLFHRSTGDIPQKTPIQLPPSHTSQPHSLSPSNDLSIATPTAVALNSLSSQHSTTSSSSSSSTSPLISASLATNPQLDKILNRYVPSGNQLISKRDPEIKLNMTAPQLRTLILEAQHRLAQTTEAAPGQIIAKIPLGGSSYDIIKRAPRNGKDRFSIQLYFGPLTEGVNGKVKRVTSITAGTLQVVKTFKVLNPVFADILLRPEAQAYHQLAGSSRCPILRHANEGNVSHTVEATLTMDYIKGGTLWTFLPQIREAHISTRYKVAKQLIQAMDDFLKRGIQHNDIHYRNIMLKLCEGNPHSDDIILNEKRYRIMLIDPYYRGCPKDLCIESRGINLQEVNDLLNLVTDYQILTKAEIENLQAASSIEQILKMLDSE